MESKTLPRTEEARASQLEMAYIRLVEEAIREGWQEIEVARALLCRAAQHVQLFRGTDAYAELEDVLAVLIGPDGTC